MLAEAAFVAVCTAGPMRAFYERVRGRRGSRITIVAVARKLAYSPRDRWSLRRLQQKGCCFSTDRALRASTAVRERHPACHHEPVRRAASSSSTAPVLVDVCHYPASVDRRRWLRRVIPGTRGSRRRLMRPGMTVWKVFGREMP